MSDVPNVIPMHPTLVRDAFHREWWVFEEKYDGWRIVAIAFDCMYVRGRYLRDRPLSYRKRALEDAIGRAGHHVYPARRLHPHGIDA